MRKRAQSLKTHQAQERNFAIFRIRGTIATVTSIPAIYSGPVVAQQVVRATDALLELLCSMKDQN